MPGAAAPGRLLRALTVVALAVWALGALDGATVLWRTGRGDFLPFAHVSLVTAGFVVALAVWLTMEALQALGRLVARLPVPTPAPGTWAPLALGGLLAVGLDPVGQVLLKTRDYRVLIIGLSAPLLGAACVLAARWLRGAQARGSRGVPLLLAGGLLAGALHLANTLLFAGLYPVLHLALSAASLLVLSAALVLPVAAASRRIQGAALGALVVSAAAALPFVGPVPRARAPVFFFGTELAQLYEGFDLVLDGDRDGYSVWGGDCDDTDPAVHPLAREVPGNGRDDNCAGGDPPVGAPPAPAPPTDSPALNAWRATHATPNVVLIFIDTLRVDRVRPDLMPRVAAFAREAVVFTQARTTAPRTPHALMGLLRGRFNGRVLDAQRRVAPASGDSLLHHLRGARYRTLARLVGTSWRRFHLDRGWTRLTARGHVKHSTGAEVSRDVVSVLERSSGPFFLVAHFADPHAPYVRHSTGSNETSMKARYDGEVAFTDARVGEVLDALDRLDRRRDTVVVLFADHGENLGDHGDAGGHHGVSLFDEVVHVPLMIRAPDVTPRRVDDAVSLADVAPTLLDLTGGRDLVDPDGCSLVGYLFGERPAPAFTLSEHYDFGHQLRAVVRGRDKLVLDARRNVWLLFDLAADPRETRDLADARPETVAELRALLDEWVDTRLDNALGPNRRCAVP